MMISILHKLISTGMVAAKVGMEEVLSEVLEGSKACMVNLIKGMARPHRRATTSIQPLQRTQVPSHSSTRHLAETALLPEVSATMGALGRHSQPRTPSNFRALVLATIVAYLMYLGVPIRTSRGRIRGSLLIWVNRAATTTKFATLVIRPKYLVVQVLR